MAKIIAIVYLLVLCCFQSDPFLDARQQMVHKQIVLRGITDTATLGAMERVPRHKFVSSDQAKYAYADRPLAIGYGQTISQPYIVAYMTEKLKLKPHHRVLEIGTGSGYQAAVLAEIVKEVYTIEIIEPLAKKAGSRLSNLGYSSISVTFADGYYGLPDKAPFDAIIVTAAADFIPPPLIEQLKEGGKMIIPVGSPFMNQYLVMVEKKNGKAHTRNLLPVRFVPFTRTEK